MTTSSQLPKPLFMVSLGFKACKCYLEARQGAPVLIGIIMNTLLCILTLVIASVAAEEKPPYSGTIFIAPDIITDKDPSSFQRLVKSGQGQRKMFDRRVNGWVDLNAHLFTAVFDKTEMQIEVQVNPEFDANAAFEQASLYLRVIGQLPAELRKDVKTVWIHKGRQGFGGGNNNLLIHTGMGEEYISKGILAETFVHEATHTSLDAYHASDKQWIAAQNRDPGFISEYAKAHPKREDLAESYLLYLALRYKSTRIDDRTKRIIERTMPNRIAYLDRQEFNMHPIVNTKQIDPGLTAAPAGDFAIHDGDTVVFLGDSITAHGGYGKVIENYTLLRYPKRKVRFINAGWGGDTAEGGARRLERDVFKRGATLVTVAYGINDIGWGTRANDEYKQKYLDGIRNIVTRCRQRNVRVYICSAAVTGEDPHKSDESYLQTMCDEGMVLARDLGGEAIDVQRAMRAIQNRIWAANAATAGDKDKDTLHAADTIHLNDLGQLAMAFAILRGLGAPAHVSSVTIDAQAGQLIEANGCQVTDIHCRGDLLTFNRLDEGLPLNFGPLGVLNFRFIPIPEQLNPYMLTVKHLEPGPYDVTVSGRLVGRYTHDQLDTGINLSSATPDAWEPGGPWDAQAATLKLLTEGRHQLAQARKLEGSYLEGNPLRSQIDAQSDDLNTRFETLQRTVARPVPYHFVLARSMDDHHVSMGGDLKHDVGSNLLNPETSQQK